MVYVQKILAYSINTKNGNNLGHVDPSEHPHLKLLSAERVCNVYMVSIMVSSRREPFARDSRREALVHRCTTLSACVYSQRYNFVLQFIRHEGSYIVRNFGKYFFKVNRSTIVCGLQGLVQ